MKKAELEATETLSAPIERQYLITALSEDAMNALEILENAVKKVDGKVLKSEDCGRRHLHTPIGKQRELSLVSVYAMLALSNLASIQEHLRHEDKILRFLLTIWREDLNATRQKRSRTKPVVEKKVHV